MRLLSLRQIANTHRWTPEDEAALQLEGDQRRLAATMRRFATRYDGIADFEGTTLNHAETQMLLDAFACVMASAGARKAP